ncbi:hypothetical protein [Nocardioides sp.]|uniref:hypothetical protein n=1 Tax=Nocardioides sp. TaxID=35761 RepID=UPI002B5B257C|nr:hypothetical protein [Nocardioides sp.]HXH80611.1 hypothetical protein [Nocardioides sp.]
MLLVLAGCGDRDGADARPEESAQLTPRAVAAVMLDHLADDTTHRQATYVDEHSPPGLVGAELRYNGDGEYDGDLVEVTVVRGEPELAPCASDAQCVELEVGVLLAWDLATPEEDPGVVALQLRRDGEVVTVMMAGPTITGDPRELELEPTVATMTELVQDPRLRLQTDAATVAAGEDVTDWRGGEVDPASLEQVPNTDATVVIGWIYAYGDAWKYDGPSAYKGEFGADAIGGRVRITGDMQLLQSGFLDALAAPEPPEWLESGCLDGYRCGTVQGVRVVWRPADGDDSGDAFLVVVRPGGETVAIHTVGNRIPEDMVDAAYAAGLGLWGSDLTDPRSETSIDVTTTRAKFQNAEELVEGPN